MTIVYYYYFFLFSFWAANNGAVLKSNYQSKDTQRTYEEGKMTISFCVSHENICG